MQTNNMLLPVPFLENMSAQWVVKMNFTICANSVSSVLVCIRFTNKNIYALVFQVHAGTQAEMAG